MSSSISHWLFGIVLEGSYVNELLKFEAFFVENSSKDVWIFTVNFPEQYFLIPIYNQWISDFTSKDGCGDIPFFQLLDFDDFIPNSQRSKLEFNSLAISVNQHP